MSEDTCQTCFYWNQKSDRGECRRHAPLPVWPLTDFRDWCGEYVNRETGEMVAKAQAELRLREAKAR